MSIYALVDGPVGTKDRETFVVLHKGDSPIEVLGSSKSSLSAVNALRREQEVQGAAFDLRKAMNRGWTYYKKTFDKLDKDTEAYLRRRYSASSEEGFSPKVREDAVRAATDVRKRALRR